MKLRLLGNSIRIRIQQKELATLAIEGFIKETLSLGPLPANTFSYSLERSSRSHELDAHFEGNCMSVFISSSLVQELVETDRVGVKFQKPLTDGKSLSILVEKDFKCLTPREEDSDAFPHPSAEHGAC